MKWTLAMCVLCTFLAVGVPARADPPGWLSYREIDSGMIWCKKKEDLQTFLDHRITDIPAAARFLAQKNQEIGEDWVPACGYGRPGYVWFGISIDLGYMTLEPIGSMRVWLVSVRNAHTSYWLFWSEPFAGKET